MKTATLNSLKDLAGAFGISVKPTKPMAPRKCFKCGGEMSRIEDTNVIICNGTRKDGKPCLNRVLIGDKPAKPKAKPKDKSENNDQTGV